MFSSPPQANMNQTFFWKMAYRIFSDWITDFLSELSGICNPSLKTHISFAAGALIILDRVRTFYMSTHFNPSSVLGCTEVWMPLWSSGGRMCWVFFQRFGRRDRLPRSVYALKPFKLSLLKHANTSCVSNSFDVFLSRFRVWSVFWLTSNGTSVSFCVINQMKHSYQVTKWAVTLVQEVFISKSKFKFYHHLLLFFFICDCQCFSAYLHMTVLDDSLVILVYIMAFSTVSER